jgi:hypothetical protein
MSIQEWIEGSGIYKVSLNALGPNTWFLRKLDVDGEAQPLLHICDKDKDPSGEVWVCMTGVVHWSNAGHYYCTECKQTFSTAEELASVWSDGKGTGDEYEA